MTTRELIIQVLEEDVWGPNSLSLVGMLFAIESKGVKIDFDELMQEVKNMYAEGMLVKEGNAFTLIQKEKP